MSNCLNCLSRIMFVLNALIVDTFTIRIDNMVIEIQRLIGLGEIFAFRIHHHWAAANLEHRRSYLFDASNQSTIIHTIAPPAIYYPCVEHGNKLYSPEVHFDPLICNVVVFAYRPGLAYPHHHILLMCLYVLLHKS